MKKNMRKHTHWPSADKLAESQHPLRREAFNVVENVVETMMDIQMMIPPKR